MISNLTKFSIDEELVSKTVKELIKEEVGEKKQVSIAFVGSERIKELNRIYRKKDYVTDVLSFLFDENDFIGEIIVCPSKIKKDFQEKDFTKELFRVIIHGALHLSGYSHSNPKQEEVMNQYEQNAYNCGN